MSDASVEMWKGMDQFGPLKVGVFDNFSLRVSKEDFQWLSYLNSTSFVRNLNSGATIFVKFSIKHL